MWDDYQPTSNREGCCRLSFHPLIYHRTDPTYLCNLGETRFENRSRAWPGPPESPVHVIGTPSFMRRNNSSSYCS
ncbi:hypothetical protein SCLCIDRAFT_166461 [Scleroderma citrinum Foug A]|uniref:Uncharacterized protein n=1 Tax=Scleroderma citrinum Foug A TaxID=1036808 RepID=A0A0C3ESD0_9AGAM|nr:hypothetical protein SCLCIDRAFT_166461 [Scleroderma citrinum Foug A]